MGYTAAVERFYGKGREREEGKKCEGSCVTQQCGVVSALCTLDIERQPSMDGYYYYLGMREEYSKGNSYWFG